MPAASQPQRFRVFGAERECVTHDALHTYCAYADKVVSLEGKVLARIRVTDRNPFGDVIRVQDK